MKLAIPREKLPGETRVALVPESVKKLVGSGFTVAVESGAGVASGYTDTQYSEAGAELKKKLTELFREAGFILRVGVPE